MRQQRTRQSNRRVWSTCVGGDQGEWKRLEGEVVMTTSTTTTMHVTYDDKANDNAMEASLDGGVQGSADFWTKSTIKLELGVERGGANVQMTMTTTMRPGEKKITPTNHKQREDASGNRGGERSQ